MTDFSQMSDEDLQAIANGNNSPTQALPDFSTMSDEDLQKLAASDQSSMPQDQGYFSRVGSDLQNRFGEAVKSVGLQDQGQQNGLETGLQIAGKTMAGSVNDVIGEGVKSAINYTPQPVIDAAKQAGNYVANTDLGQAGIAAAKQGMDAYKGWASDNPRAARDLESTVDIAGMLPVGKMAEAAAPIVGKAADATGTALQKAGDYATQAGVNQANKMKMNFVQDLITPKVTPTVAADQFSRSTEQGLLKNRVVEPTPQEQAIAQTVASLPVSKNNSLLKNYNIISDANDQEAQDLIARLKDNDVAVHPKEVDDALDGSLEQLKQNPYITGDAETSASRVINGMKYHVTNNDSTVSGLLQARKDFDAWVKSQKGKGVFDPSRDSAVTTAIQNVRQTVNNLVDQKVPDAGVKASLQKQSNLYRAMDNIESKGASEAPNMVSRAAQKVGDLLPVKGAIAKGALAAGLGGAAAYAPAAVGAGLGVYGVGKVLNSPMLKKGVGAALTGAGNMLRNGAEDAVEAPLEKPLLTYKPRPDFQASPEGPIAKTPNSAPFQFGQEEGMPFQRGELNESRVRNGKYENMPLASKQGQRAFLNSQSDFAKGGIMRKRAQQFNNKKGK